MKEYFDPDTYPKEWNYLQSGTIIDQYMIERELAHGGFSSVYLARQMSDQVQVAIKEYLPRKLAHRTWNNTVVANDEESKTLFLRGRALFFEEAKVLADLKHPNIVEVINFFQANSTVYIVMTYDYGVTLDKLIKKVKINVTDEFLTPVFKGLLLGLDAIHQQQILHLDIKPANILVRPGNNPMILDFGAIKSYPKNERHKSAKVLTKGYSPIEQYQAKNPLGPWTDIYAFGASLRACLDGKTPVPAPQREEHDTMVPAVKAYKNKFSPSLLEAVDWAMRVQPEERPQSVSAIKKLLEKL